MALPDGETKGSEESSGRWSLDVIHDRVEKSKIISVRAVRVGPLFCTATMKSHNGLVP